MERLATIVLSALLAAGPAAAQEGSRQDGEPAGGQQQDGEEEFFDRTPRDCIMLGRRLRRTKIIDETTILFYMRNDDVYRNVLERGCPGLNSRRILAFTAQSTASSGRLCRSDTIEHYSMSGGALFGSSFCTMGRFHPITREEAELIELEPDELSVVRSTSELTPVDPDDAEPRSGDGAAPDGSAVVIGEEPAEAE